MVAEPVATPVSTPLVLMEAMLASVVLHTPPVIDALSAEEPPGQTVVEPDRVPAPGEADTCNEMVTLVAPQALVTE